MNKLSNSSLLYALAFILSVCSLSYEIVLAQYVGLLSGEYVFFQTICIGVYLLGMGGGSILYTKSNQSIEKSLILNEVYLALLGAVSVILIDLFHLSYRIIFRSEPWGMGLFYMLSLFVIFLIGYLSGKEIPLLIDLADKFKLKNRINRTLFFSYLGGVVGSLFITFFLLRQFSFSAGSQFVALINLGCFIVLYLWFKEKIDKKLLLASSFALVLSFILAPMIHQFTVKNFYYGFKLKDLSFYSDLIEEVRSSPSVERYHTQFQMIDIVPRNKKEFELYLNHHLQFISGQEKRYHYSMVDLPLQVIGDKEIKKSLVLGGGDGLVVRNLLEATKSNIKIVELDPFMITLANSHPELLRLNAGSLLNPRVNVVTTDAYSWIKNYSDEKFEFAVLDFPWPSNTDVAKLFSVEFYTNVIDSLTDDGVIVIDYPFSYKEIHQEIRSTIISTILAAGFESVFIWNDGFDGYLMACKKNMANLYGQRFRSMKLKMEEQFNQKAFREFYVYTKKDMDQAYINKVYEPRILRYKRENFYDEF